MKINEEYVYVIQIDDNSFFLWRTKPEESTSLYENDIFNIHEYENIYTKYYCSLDDEEQWNIKELNSEQSASILLNFRECLKVGTFLIRKSENNKGVLTLCFL